MVHEHLTNHGGRTTASLKRLLGDFYLQSSSPIILAGLILSVPTLSRLCHPREPVRYNLDSYLHAFIAAVRSSPYALPGPATCMTWLQDPDERKASQEPECPSHSPWHAARKTGAQCRHPRRRKEPKADLRLHALTPSASFKTDPFNI